VKSEEFAAAIPVGRIAGMVEVKNFFASEAY
jgi:hypothetical protein